MDPGEKAERDPSYPRGIAFWIGIGLMASSFGVFLFYLTIPFLPVSPEVMTSLLVGGWIASWGLFFIGTLLAGKEGYLFLKKRVKGWFRRT